MALSHQEREPSPSWRAKANGRSGRNRRSSSFPPLLFFHTTGEKFVPGFSGLNSMGRNSSTTAQLLRSFLILSLTLVLFGVSCWWLLRTGIGVEHLALGGTDIHRLSVRLEQGLILRIGRLELAGGEGATEIGDWQARLSLFGKWGHLLQEVDIARISCGGEHTAAVSYRAGRFRGRFGRILAEAVLAYRDDTLLLNRIALRIPSRQFAVSGVASYAVADDRLLFHGRFAHPLVSGGLWLEQEAGQVEAALTTDQFPELVPVLALFPIDREVITWVEGNISAAGYRIKDLRFRFDPRDIGAFGPANISGTAVADAVTVRFDPALEPVRCDRVHISYAGDRLSFALDNPEYRGKSLQGSSVSIDNVVGRGSVLGIDLMVDTGKDAIVGQLLDHYGVNFPARQISGTTRVDLRLLFTLSDFTMAVGGRIRSGPGTWAWRNLTLKTGGVDLQLINHRLRVVRADLAMPERFRAEVTGDIDTQSRHGELQSVIDTLDLTTAGTTILAAVDLRTRLTLDYRRDGFQVKLPELQSILLVGPQRVDLEVGSLRAVTPFVPLLRKLEFREGRIALAMVEGASPRFSGEIDIPNSFLSLGGQPVSQFAFQGAATPQRTEVALNDNNILVSWTDRLAVNLNGYLLTIDTGDYADDKEFSTPIPVNIVGSHSLLKVKGHQIATGTFELSAENSDLAFRAELERGTVAYTSTPAGKSFVGRNLDAGMVDNFIKSADLTGGAMDVYLKGQPGNFEGYLEMNNILIKDTKLLNNILAFLNAVPALATFSSPGFDPDGYRVREGVVYLHYRDSILTIDELRTDGVTINTEARGWINHADNTLELTMELIALKDYSRIIEKIPLAGYAILGENGSLSTSLDIRGSIDDPEITTNLAREILMSPVNIIRRTLEWPFRLLDSFGAGESEAPEPE